MTFEQAVKKSGLTPDQIKSFQNAAQRTWEYVAYDVLTAVHECEGETSIPRSEVIELVLDANYMDRHLNDEVVLKWKNQPWKSMPKDYFEVMKSLLVPAFPFKRYGW